MADETDDDKPDPAVINRQRAQGAAGDLARMGIDPRSLGLGEALSTTPDRTSEQPLPQDDSGGSVVQLRPNFVPEPDPVPAEAEAPPEAVTEDRRTTAPPPPPARRDHSRLLRSVAKGLVTPDAAINAQSERVLVESVRQRQTDRRVVAFVSGKGGVGVTTVAMGVATTFAALREDRSVVVDVQSGTPSLGELYDAAAPLSITGLLGQTEATDPPTSPAQVGLIDGVGWDQSVDRSHIAGVLDRLGEEHAFHLLDAGNDAADGGHAALARADQVVVVTGPGHLGGAALAVVLDRLRSINPAVLPAVVQVVVCPHESAYREAQKDLAGAGVVLIGPDAHLQAGRPYDPQAVSAQTREALLRVAAGVAGGGLRR